MKELTRRSFIGSTIVAGLALGTVFKPQKAKASQKSKSRDNIYKDGKLDIAAVKQAYFEMFTKFDYPVPDVLKTDEFWVADFKQGDMLNLGMGGIFWVNEFGKYATHGSKKYNGNFGESKFGYLGHEIFLLPGQTLPEHRHIGGDEGFGPKMEAWQVRYGEVTFYGEHQGEGTEVELSKLPENKRPWGYGEAWMKSRFGVTRNARSGRPYLLKDPESWHGQRAGEDGAIVTEYATYHNHVMFSKPEMVFASTGH